MSTFKSIQRSDFPSNFIFGAATAAYQIEGSALGGQSPTMGYSHWDSFSATRGNVWGGQTGATACQHLEYFEQDLDLLKDAGFDAYRFSFSWPRLIPDGTGSHNQKGWDFYDRLIDAILARGIKPNATLYHWDLPSAISDQGGWLNRDIAHWFADYAVAVNARFGDRLAMCATINEPWCISYLSHFLGAHAPGHRDIRSCARSMHHVLYAHGCATIALRQENAKPALGLVLNLQACEAFDNSAENRWAAERLDGICNRWFLDGVLKGTYPSDIVQALTPWLPDNFQDDMLTIRTPLDWLGINYYTRELACKSSDPTFPGIDVCRGDLPKTDIGWEIYPKGLVNILTRLRNDYHCPPLYITENGQALYAPNTADSHVVSDPERVSYYDTHLAACSEAIQAGSDLRGYFGWSLLDNYEWAEGYSQRFGMIHVDFDSQKRTPKESYIAFQAMLKR